MEKNTESNQPTEMIVLSKGEYDLLRERATAGYHDGEIDLIDLLLIPLKGWRLIAGLTMLGLALGVYLSISAGIRTSVSSILQSGLILNTDTDTDANTNLLLKSSEVESLFLSPQVLEPIKISLQANRYSLGYDKKNKKSALAFYDSDAINEPPMASVSLVLNELNTGLGIIEIGFEGKIPIDVLENLNNAFLQELLLRQKNSLSRYQQRIAAYRQELGDITSAALADDASGELFKRKSFLEEVLYRDSQVQSKPTLVLQQSPPVSRWSKKRLILPILAFGILAVLAAFLAEFLVKADIGTRLKSIKNQ